MSKRVIGELYNMGDRTTRRSSARLKLDAVVDKKSNQDKDTIHYCKLEDVSLELSRARILGEILRFQT